MNNNYDIFNKALELQFELNDQLQEDWVITLSKDDYFFAAFVEAGELADSIGYKWWKKQEPDWDNFKVECIDIFHFLMSGLYWEQECNRKDACYLLTKGIEDYYKVLKNKDRKSIVKELILQMFRRDLVSSFYYLGILFGVAGYKDFISLQKDYLIKLTLNKFRNKNGYLDGTYVKIWGKKEDNIWAYDLSKKIELSNTDEFIEKLFNELQVVYDGFNK